MDPLSITISTLVIVGAGGKVAKALKKLLALRDVPDALLVLNNKVNEIHCVVRDIQTVLEQCSKIGIASPIRLTSALQ